MISLDTTLLKDKKNLLAFSAGVDSSALFFLLIENHIKFDIAIVDYGMRAQSKKEIDHAKVLAQKFHLQCHATTAPLFQTHFEKKAREFRYAFFDSLINAEGYDNLLTAHQLNDQLEWLLMRLSKGAGVSELLGLAPISKREHYTLLRPLLSYPKDTLLQYLKHHQYPYFIDESNDNEMYERNKFRKQFSDALLEKYAEGIGRSFEYLYKDKQKLESTFELIYTEKLLSVIQLYSATAKVKAADITLKKQGYLLSAAQRKEIEHKDALVIGGVWAIVMQGDFLYISPYITEPMPKKFKELCRINHIPSKIRPYIFKENISLPMI